jgi:organic radical activating enzyme
MKNICVLPWISVDRNTEVNKDRISLSPCCYYNSKGNYQDIDEYWNSKEIQQLRQQFTKDERPSGCSICWKLEDNNMKSLRMSVNESRLGKYKERFNKSFLEDKPVQVKYTVGNQCNLSCRMCVPTSSMGVQKVWQAIGRSDKPKLDTFDYYNYILDNSETIRYIDVMGGEPFYHKKTKQLLQTLVDKQHADKITLYIVSNATKIDQKTISLLKHFKEVVLTISTDGVGKLQEYIRPGLKWSQFESNLELIKKNNINFQIASTLNVLNILNYEELEDWCMEKGYNITNPTIIEYPKEMAPHNLPIRLRHLVPERFKQILDSKEIDADSLNFVRQLDKYWNTDVTKVIPQWQDVLDNLHWSNIEQLKQMDKELEKYVE